MSDDGIAARLAGLEDALREQWTTTASALQALDRRLDALEDGLRESWTTTEASLRAVQAAATGERPLGERLPPPPAEVRTIGGLTGPEHDVDPPWEQLPPAHTYVVCSTQRSGSTLLCRGLTDAGAGVPMEYLNALRREALSDRWGTGPSLGRYTEALHAHRTTPPGVFGTKLHWDQLCQLRAELLEIPLAEPSYADPCDALDRWLPGARYVHISRLDVDRQAVSFWRSLRRNLWSEKPGDEPAADEAAYSFEGIERCRRVIENGEVHWDRYFAVNGIEPLRVTYEELVAGYETTVARVARAVVPGHQPPPLPSPPTRRMADERSEAMLERYLAERVDRGLPDPLAV